jgi:hypothetical protein
MTIAKIEALPCVDLSDAAEERLLETARRCGGGVVEPDQAALKQLMVNTVALLAEIDAALTLPPIIQDTVRCAN